MYFIRIVLTLIFAIVATGSPFVSTATGEERALLDIVIMPTRTLMGRNPDPTFPASPPSCPICERSYPNISSCAQAAPVLANFSQVLFDPGAFISVIKCSCTDTFQSAFPQCVDCFQRTNQTDVITSQGASLPSVLSGLRTVCIVASTLLGNVTATNGEQVNGTPISVASPSPSTSGAASSRVGVLVSFGMGLTAICLSSTLL